MVTIKNMNRNLILGVVAVVLVGVSFYGGMAYGKSGSPVQRQMSGGQFMGAGQNGAANMRSGMGGGMGGGLTAGEIISKDASGITIKMQNGSTKIVLIGDSVSVMKSAVGTAEDLSVGTSVSVTGTANSDGSVTAQSVQIRPAGTGEQMRATQ